MLAEIAKKKAEGYKKTWNERNKLHDGEKTA